MTGCIMISARDRNPSTPLKHPHPKSATEDPIMYSRGHTPTKETGFFYEKSDRAHRFAKKPGFWNPMPKS